MTEAVFHVYVLHSRALDRHYVGQTGNVEERLRFHMDKSTPYTAQADDWQLIFLERVATRRDAMALEKRIKQAKSRLPMARYIADDRNWFFADSSGQNRGIRAVSGA